MARQKKQKTPLLITHGHVDVNKLLTYKTDTAKPLADDDASKKAKKETPLFYNKPIHKAKKHDLL